MRALLFFSDPTHTFHFNPTHCIYITFENCYTDQIRKASSKSLGLNNSRAYTKSFPFRRLMDHWFIYYMDFFFALPFFICSVPVDVFSWESAWPIFAGYNRLPFTRNRHSTHLFTLYPGLQPSWCKLQKPFNQAVWVELGFHPRFTDLQTHSVAAKGNHRKYQGILQVFKRVDFGWTMKLNGRRYWRVHTIGTHQTSG